MTPTTYRPTFPLAALVACETPEEIAVWIALAWYQAAYPQSPVVPAVIAHLVHIPEDDVPAIIATLETRQLVQRTASGKVKVPHMLWEYLSTQTVQTVLDHYRPYIPNADQPAAATTFTIVDDPEDAEDEDWGDWDDAWGTAPRSNREEESS